MSKQSWIEDAIVLLKLDNEEVRSKLCDLSRLWEQQEYNKIISIKYAHNTKHEEHTNAKLARATE